MSSDTTTRGNETVRWLLIAGLVVVAFFGAYRFASAIGSKPAVAAGGGSSVAAQNGGVAPAPNSATAGGSSSAGGGCACCGGSSQPTANGVTGPQVEGTAQIAGGVQAIAVQVTTVYSPNVIHLKAGVPAEITFGSAQGCTSQVVSQQLGFSEDLSAGPKLVKIADPKPGTYDFACGMNMVHGTIVVQ